MPYLIVNYGAEMIFILEQRLNAQAVRGEKSTKVLQDVSNALFSKSFVEELVRPQLLFSRTTTREIFDRLAHSSIMRLSEASMDKLYDLMTMGVKYQVAACRVPRDLATVTAVHLDGVRVCVKAADGTSAVDDASRMLLELSRQLSEGQMQDVRHSLLNFFQGKRVKISLLMAEGLQTKTGSLVIQRGSLPKSDVTFPTMPVGAVSYFDPDSGAVVRSEVLKNHPDFGIEAKPPVDVRLGKNLYVSDKSKTSTAADATSPTGPASSPKTQQQQAAPPRHVDDAFRAVPTGKRHFAPAAQNAQTAITTLSNFIVQHAPKETIKIQNLFDEPAAGSPQAGGAGVDVIHIGKTSREEIERANSELLSVRDSFGFDASPKVKQPTQDDDLLDLLDSA
jgi:hypothetical protein